jgi:hypothetical protein
MTMQHESHPHDERLAALAGADPEATDDRSLRDHVAGCDRCRAVVNDLALLRSALAELPDLQPSRPLQLLPPVAALVARRGGALGLLRRLSAPALAASVGLILVGAVGSSGVLEGLSGLGAAGAAPGADSAAENYGPEIQALSSEETARAGDSALNPDAAGSPEASPSDMRGGVASGASPSPKAAAATEGPTDQGRDGDVSALSSTTDPFDGRLPWLLVLGAGIALAAGSLLLRFTVQPRAG